MRKRILGSALILILVLSMLTVAASARVPSSQPSLTFSGTTAICFAKCSSADPSDSIHATLTLRENGTLVAGWSDSGTGSVTLSKPYAATSGASYTLTLSYSINGVKQDPVSVSATCP